MLARPVAPFESLSSIFTGRMPLLVTASYHLSDGSLAASDGTGLAALAESGAWKNRQFETAKDPAGRAAKGTALW